MEKIKSLLTGHKHEDNTSNSTTGSTTNPTTSSGDTHGHSSGTTGAQGSHLAGSHDNLGSSNTTSQNTTSGLGDTQTTGGLGSSNTTSHNTSSGLGNSQNTGLSSGTSGNQDSLGSAYTTAPNTSSGLGSSQNTGLSSGTSRNQDSLGSAYTTGQNTSSTGASSGTAGPHDSNLANKVDPRVDSDRDGSKTIGGAGNTSTTGYGNTTSGAFPDDSTNTASGAGYGSGNSLGNTSSTGANYGSSATNPTSSGNNYGTSTTNPTSGTGYSSGNTSGLTGSNQGQQSHLGRDAAGLGAAGLVGEHEHRKHEGVTGGNTSSTGTNFGSSTTNPTSSGAGYNSGNTSSGLTGSNQGQQSHLTGGNTSAVGSGTNFGSSTTNPTSSGGAGNGTTFSGLTDSYQGQQSGLTGSSQGQQSHLGRDAAGLGAVGAIGEHEHRKHEGITGSGNNLSAGNNYGSSTTNPTSAGAGYGSSTNNPTSSGAGYSGSNIATVGNTGHTGPHKTEAANRLDPAVNTSSAVGLENYHHHDPAHGGGAEEADSSHHLGRDAAVGAGGVGLAEHERRKHEQGTGISGSSGTTGLGQSTRAYDDTTGVGSQQSSHLGRDAGLAGGVGAAGYEADKHHQQKHDKDLTHAEREAKKEHKHELKEEKKEHKQEVKEEKKEHKQEVKEEKKENKQELKDEKHGQHTGRDAALVGGGVGGAGLAEHEHRKHETASGSGIGGTSTASGTGYTSSGQSGQSNLGRDSTVGGTGVGAASSLPGPAPNTAGPHKKDWLNKLDPRVDATGTKDQTATDSSSKDHHYGRDAGIAGGVGAAGYEADKHHQKHDKDLTHEEREAKKEHKHELKEEKREEKHEHHAGSHAGRDAGVAGGVGAAGYEADKHHHNTSGLEGNTNKPLPTAPGNHGVGTGAGTQNALSGDNTTSTSSGSHLGRDAALVGGIGGAGALGEHEHNKYSSSTGTSGLNATPLDQKPRGTELGDKLHGADRNRGVIGTSGFPDTPGYGSGSTGQHNVGAVGGATAAWKQHEQGNPNSGIINSSGLPGSSTGSAGQSSHLGQSNTSSGLAGSNQGIASHPHSHEHHHGHHHQSPQEQQAAGFPTIDHHTTSHDPAYSSSVYDSGNTVFQSEKHAPTTGGSSDWNKLHKDTSSSTGGVPKSSSERQQLVGEGEQRLDDNSGVAHAHGQSGNSTSNY